MDTQAQISHVFNSTGEKMIRLKALSSAGKPHDKDFFVVNVVPKRSIDEPFHVDLVGTLRPGPSSERRMFEISENVLSEPGEKEPEEYDYSEVIGASRGYQITEAKFLSSNQSTARKTILVDGRTIDITPAPTVEILDQGNSVRLQYQLRTDPGQGISTAWLSGSLVIHEERLNPGNEVEIYSGLLIDRYSSYPLPTEADLSKFETIALKESGGRILASGIPGELLRSDERDLQFSFEFAGRGYRLFVSELFRPPPDLPNRVVPTPSAPPG